MTDMETSQIMMRFLRCHICSETMMDPVSLNCNHSFCKNCLTQYLNQTDSRKCPVCNRELPETTPAINTCLKVIADTFAGRTELDATKKQDVLCDTHRKTPSWFCVDEEIAVCEACHHPLRHAGHKLKRVTEAVESVRIKDCRAARLRAFDPDDITLCMAHFGHVLSPGMHSEASDIMESLCSKLEQMERQLDLCIYADEVYKDMVKHMASQRAATEGRIKEEFEQLHQLLREEEEARLAAVREEEEEKRKRIDRELDIIQGQMLTLENAIHQVEQDLKLENLAFLKHYKQTASRAQCILHDPQLLSGVLLDQARHLGNLKHRVCAHIQERVQHTPVILDPNTAAGWLVLSEDLTSVRYMTPKQDLPDNPERFMEHAIVLGSQGFSSGRHTWEVDVGDRVKWVIGVARETVDRKKDCFLKPQYGLWSIWKYNDEYRATGQRLPVQSALQRITVELDYEAGHVAFYDSRDMTLLFRYRDQFKERMFPYFNPQADTSQAPLQMCPSRGGQQMALMLNTLTI